MGNAHAATRSCGNNEQGSSAGEDARHRTTRVLLGELDPKDVDGKRYIHVPPAESFTNANISRPTDLNREAHVEYNPLTGNYTGLDEAVHIAHSAPWRESDTQGSTMQEMNRRPSLLGRFRPRNRASSTSVPRPTKRCDFSTACFPGLKERFKSRWSAGASSRPHSSTPPPVYIANPYDFHCNAHVSDSPVGLRVLADLPREWVLHEAGVFDTDSASTSAFFAENPQHQFTDIVKIGEGSSGAVFRAYDTVRGETVAIKRLDVSSDDEVLQEVAVMRCGHHANLMACYDVYKVGTEMFITMELADAGSLTDLLSYLSDYSLLLSEPEIAYICREVLLGLNYLHAMERMHRDIKSDNTLLTRAGRVKIADFGLAAEVTANRKTRNSVVGTIYWMAPEVCRGAEYDCRVDVWGTGILAIECADRIPPLFEVPEQEVRTLIARASTPPQLQEPMLWTSDFRDFIEQCTEVDATKRASAGEMLWHPFLQRAATQDHMATMFSAAAIAHAICH